MSTPASKTVTPPELLKACVPLGQRTETAWTPLGAGVLLFEHPFVWVATARSVLAQAGDRPVFAWVSDDQGGTVVDLSAGLTEAGLAWVEHPSLDLAISLFPFDPAWGLLVFVDVHCLPAEKLGPLVGVSSIACPYGTGALSEKPMPMALGGVISRTDADGQRLFSSAPLFPQNAGAPLVVGPDSKGIVYLAGSLTHTILVPEVLPVPPIRISVATTTDAIWELIHSDAAQEQRALAE